MKSVEVEITEDFYQRRKTRRIRTLVWLLILLSCLAFWGVVFMTGAKVVRADVIDLQIIAKIESSNNPLAYNQRSGARGMYQFRKIAWLDVQQNFPELAKYPFSYAYKPQVARLFAKAYFVLVDRYLRHYGLKTSLSNQLLCYNQGIGLTRKGIVSKESANYILKYQRLVKGTNA